MENRFKKEKKDYFLKNKDTLVLTFNCEKIIDNTKFGKFATYNIKNIKILEKDLLPVDFLENFSNLQLNSPNLKKWIDSRKVPSNRENVEEILLYQEEMQGVNDSNNFMRYVDISFALSLNDSYWILPEDKKDYLWKDYNLYENRFDEILSLIAFGENKVHNSNINEIKISPEYTTDGMLAKCWIVLDDEINLIKKSSEIFKKEAYSEYYMSQIAEIMNFNHIKYDIIEYHKNIVSSCKLFTNKDTGFIPMHKCLSTNDKTLKNMGKLLEKIENKLGEDFLSDLMIFDSIIGNTDRHLGNFGVLIDNKTNKIISPAPIFDNGNCFLASNYENSQDYLKFKASKFDINFEELSKKFIKERHREGLEKLKTFSFKRHSKYNLSEESLIKGENFIRERARQILFQLNKKLEKNKEVKKKSLERKN